MVWGDRETLEKVFLSLSSFFNWFIFCLKVSSVGARAATSEAAETLSFHREVTFAVFDYPKGPFTDILTSY